MKLLLDVLFMAKCVILDRSENIKRIFKTKRRDKDVW